MSFSEKDGTGRQSDLSRKELERQEAESLPDREGTLDSLRNEASADQEGATGSKDDPKVLDED